MITAKIRRPFQCADGHRGGQQRRFAITEIEKLAAIFGVPAAALTTRCAIFGGKPPAGYACLACGAVPSPGCPAAPGRWQEHSQLAARQ